MKDLVASEALQAAKSVAFWHPRQYAVSDGGVLDHSDLISGIRGERFNRCHRCEEWSPCSPLVVAEALLSWSGVTRESAVTEMADALE